MIKESKRVFSSPLALGLLATVPTALDPVEAILLNARMLLMESGMKDPPYFPERYANVRQIENIVDRDMRVDGRLVPHGERFIVELRRDRSPERKNFTCAHEIAHTFFYEAVPSIKYRSDVQSADPDEEALCDIAAAELLMPLKVIRRIANDYSPSPQSLRQLAQMFQTSLTATIIRLLGLQIWNVAFVFWERSSNGVEARWLARKTGKLSYAPPLKIINQESSGVQQALATGETTTSWEYLLTDSGVRPCRVQSMRVGANKVLSCLGVRATGNSSTENERRDSFLPLTYSCECNGTGWRSARKGGRVSSSKCLAVKHDAHAIPSS
jgi:Zn-dependent peptidase ImmA (M78 family)